LNVERHALLAHRCADGVRCRRGRPGIERLHRLSAQIIASEPRRRRTLDAGQRQRGKTLTPIPRRLAQSRSICANDLALRALVRIREAAIVGAETCAGIACAASGVGKRRRNKQIFAPVTGSLAPRPGVARGQGEDWRDQRASPGSTRRLGSRPRACSMLAVLSSRCESEMSPHQREHWSTLSTVPPM